MYDAEFAHNSDKMRERAAATKYEWWSQSDGYENTDSRSPIRNHRRGQTHGSEIDSILSERPFGTRVTQADDARLSRLLDSEIQVVSRIPAYQESNRNDRERRDLPQKSYIQRAGNFNRSPSPFQDEYESRSSDYAESLNSPETKLEDELLRVHINGGPRSPPSRSTRVSQSANLERYRKRDLGQNPDKSPRIKTNAKTQKSCSSEKGLDEERFPSYLSPQRIEEEENNPSDTQSQYSMVTESSATVPRRYQKRSVNTRSTNSTHSRSPTSSIRSAGPVKQISSRRKHRKASSSSMEVENSSVLRYTPGFDQEYQQTTRDHERTRKSLGTQEYDAETLTSRDRYRGVRQQNSRSSISSHGSGKSSRQSMSKAERSNSSERNCNETRPPRNSLQGNGQRTSRSSITSNKSGKEVISHLTIPEETKPNITSESDINTQSNPSSPRPSSNNSRKSSSGRGSQSSRQSENRRADMGDVDSIGSATSIILRTQSRTSRSSGAKSLNVVDQDEEILVGDEKELHDAARKGECETVEQLLEIGTDINCRNETDRTPIHWAAGNGHTQLLKIMLDHDANIEAADKFGMTALLWAAWFGHGQCVQMLLRAGAKPTSKNKNGYTFLHCAAQNNHMMVERILTEDLQDFDRNTTDDGGRTCLHILAKHGRKDMLEKLIQLHCDVNAKDKAENTPLHLAAKYGFCDLISILVEAGANIEDKNSEQKSALHLAAEEGKSEAVEELIKLDADVNAETEEEVCPLHLAVSGGHESAAIALLNGGADVDAGNKHNQTPLYYAVMGNRLPLVQVLAMHNADPNVQDARQETPLHLAAENGNWDIAEVILRTNVNLSMTDQRGKTPLDVAARGSFITIVDMIVKAERHHLYLKTSAEHYLGYSNHSLDHGSASLDVPDGLAKQISFKPDNSPETQHIRTLLYKLATKYLKRDEWRKLAFQWGFTDLQVQAIEEQYTGEKSYREHGYRMLLIWLNGCILTGENPTRSLFEGLVTIQRRDLAETMRSKANALPTDKSCAIS